MSAILNQTRAACLFVLLVLTTTTQCVSATTEPERRRKLFLSSLSKYKLDHSVATAKKSSDDIKNQFKVGVSDFVSRRKLKLDSNSAELATIKEEWETEDFLLKKDCKRNKDPELFCGTLTAQLKESRALEISEFVQKVRVDKNEQIDAFRAFLVELMNHAFTAIGIIKGLLITLATLIKSLVDESTWVTSTAIIRECLQSVERVHKRATELIPKTVPDVVVSTVCFEIDNVIVVHSDDNDVFTSEESKANLSNSVEVSLELSMVSDKVDASVFNAHVLAVEFVEDAPKLRRHLQNGRRNLRRRGSFRGQAEVSLGVNDVTDELVSDVVRRTRNLARKGPVKETTIEEEAVIEEEPSLTDSFDAFALTVMDANGFVELEADSTVKVIPCAQFRSP